MNEKCCKCGKEAVLNEKGECFDCAEVAGIKLTKIQGISFPKKMAAILFLAFAVINIWRTYYLFLKCHANSEIIVLGYIAVAIALTCAELAGSRSEYKYPCWEKPIVLLVAKYIVSFIFGFRKDQVFFSGQAMQSIKVAFCFIVVWIVVQIAFTFHKRNKILEENGIFTQMKSRFSDMPKVAQWYYTISNDEISEKIPKEVDYAVDMIRCFDCEEDIKEKVIQLIQNRDSELYVTNEVKLYYCKAIENCMDAAFRKYENGDWVNEIRYDMENGFAIAEELPKSTYVTKELFELSQMVRRELSEPWKHYLEWEQKVGMSQNFQLFRSESIGITLGEAGEHRVADELKPYEGQVIILPNLRLEVEGESIENDFVLVSPYGVYALEVKNLGSGGSYGLYIEKDGRWNKMRGNSLEYMESPVHQNERHILYLEKYINLELGRDIDNYLRVQGIVVIANDRVDIKNESDNLILRYNNIMSTIRKQPVIMKEEDMKKIAEILLDAGLGPKEYPMSNYFNCYFNAKVLTEDYLRWKESTKELKEYSDRYRTGKL